MIDQFDQHSNWFDCADSTMTTEYRSVTLDGEEVWVERGPPPAELRVQRSDIAPKLPCLAGLKCRDTEAKLVTINRLEMFISNKDLDFSCAFEAALIMNSTGILEWKLWGNFSIINGIHVKTIYEGAAKRMPWLTTMSKQWKLNYWQMTGQNTGM